MILYENLKDNYLFLTMGKWTWRLSSFKECVTTHLSN